MKSISFTRALTLGCLMGLAALPLACGDDDDDAPSSNEGGSGGSGGTAGAPDADAGETSAGGGMPSTLPPGLSDEPSDLECGGETCDSSPLLGGQVHVNPCCATGDVCGLSTDFLDAANGGFDEACQPLDQPATDDDSCPESESATLPVGSMMAPLQPLPGCCRADTGTCGYVLDAVTLQLLGPIGNLGLGCVDAAPFLAEGETAAPCGPGAGGAGNGGAGGGGAGGAGASGGGAGSGGAPDGIGGAGGAQ